MAVDSADTVHGDQGPPPQPEPQQPYVDDPIGRKTARSGGRGAISGEHETLLATSRKLWLGFGTLTLLLVLAIGFIVLDLQSVEGQLRELLQTRARVAAIRELEISLLDYALGVHQYFETAAPEVLRTLAADAGNVDHHRAEYERLVATDRHRALATRVDSMWSEFHAFGQALLTSKNTQSNRETLRQFDDLRLQLGTFLDQEMKSQEEGDYVARQRLAEQEVRNVTGVALITLLGGSIIALVTSVGVGRGIVRAQRSVWRNGELLRVTLASIGDAMMTTDTEGRVTYLNGVAEQLTGWSNAEAKGRPLTDVFRIINERTRQAAPNPAIKAMTEGVVVGLANHTVLIAKDGAKKPIDDSAAPIHDEAGTIVGSVLIFRDLTERRKADRALSESEARKAAILEAALDGIITIDQEGKIVDFNPAAERTFGRQRVDVLGKEMAELLMPPALRPQHRQGLAHYLATGEGPILGKRLELTALRVDGSEFPIELAVTRISSQGPPLFTGHIRDITERKEAERAVKEREEYFRRMADSAPAMLWMTDPSGYCTFLSRGWYEFTGQTEESGLGYGWLEAVHPDERDSARTTFLAANEKRESFFMDYRVRRRDGVYSWVINAGRPRFDARGNFAGYIGSVIDISDRKEAERERETLLAREKAARAEAETANFLKDEFLATVSHELRTPLNAMLGWADMLRSGKLDDLRAGRAVQAIYANARRQAQLVEDLLDTSRIISGKVRLDIAKVDLITIVRGAMDVITPAAESKRITIETDLDPIAAPFSGDATRLQQIVWNLLSNAVKFTPPGGRVGIRLRRVDGRTEISVWDTGVGISPAFLPHVFERFRQAETGTTKSQSGLGLGLSIVRHLVELHGGTIRVASPGEGRGTTFTVSLPVLPVAPSLEPDTRGSAFMTTATVGVPTTDQAPPLVDVRVLVVDDEPDAREVITIALQECGATVMTAGSASEALDALQHYSPNVLIVDIAMPGEDGYSLIKKVRGLPLPTKARVPAAALTAHARPEDRERALRAGFDVHLPKPLEARALCRAVAELVTRNRTD